MILSRIKQCFIHINLFCMIFLQTTVNCEKLSAHMSLKVQGIGFHRDLTYQIHFDHFIEGCYVALYLQLSSALYLNVNELAHLRKINTVCSSGETDVELFAENAQVQNVTICSYLSHTDCAMKIPIHQRYQYANRNNRYMNITLPRPKLLLGCKQRIREYRISKTDLCSSCAETASKWREIPYSMDVEDIWTIPVGDINMVSLVSYVTLIITALCTIFLVQTIRKSVPRQHPKRE
ncbi:Phosphatidylinositol-glycan biosynthesis class X protein [Habropoda laboriosa]|uniref:Phosphatidylinositol-glycan biosynthesis class X protein n=1 Tax=Habropoda laboriosa TaxID=597456 RepID=A0A0L7R1F2_9HYME|nr:Phosphatidylinositol-glycan biosynthesis class X protein [Habropoda laboriosa]